ncbi:hypothetical protein [Sphingobacterium olei]|uniref:hypothetical protein n=1 Tax=Sphingobacterium olei TaxID=2571155 RepID=UPI00138FAAFD|nr:hypothetical protein [Sphingobacterium olei]
MTTTKHFNPVKRFDGGKKNGEPGAPHNGRIDTPHVQGKEIEARKPTADELPENNRFKR